MLNSVIRFSLRYRMLIVLVALGVLGYGCYLSTQLPIDVLPDLDRPRVVILTECPGLAAEEVEKLVSQPIEIALLGSTGVQAVRSQSAAGLSVIYIEFGWSTEVRAARQTVQERMATVVGTLPPGITPYLTPTSSILGQIVIAGICEQHGPRDGELAPIGKTDNLAELLMRADGQPELAVWKPVERERPETWEAVKLDRVEWLRPAPNEAVRLDRRAVVVVAGQAHETVFPSEDERKRALRTFAEWVVRPRLRKVPGVAEVFVQGGERKQYHVLVDPPALQEYGVSLQDVEKALKENNVNASGGFAVQGDTERPIRVIGRLGPDPAKVIEDLRKIPVKTTPQRTILLEQVAKVEEGSAFKRGDGGVNGRPGIVLTIAKQPHVDTRAVTDEITRALRETETSLPASVVINPDLFKLKNFIDLGIYNVGEALVIGAFLVLIVLFLFLLNFRTTFITLTAIPLSLVLTTLVFRLVSWLTGTQLSINVMTLGGIAVAMGELVDDAVVDVENIFRRLKENNLLPPSPPLRGRGVGGEGASLSPSPPTPLPRSGGEGRTRRPALRVVFEASKEVRSAIVFGTAVVILVFLPLFALSGVEGRLFTPLGIAYITSILASLLVSLTVTPVLSYYLLPQSRAAHREHDSFLVRGLKWGAGYLIRFSMSFAWLLLPLTWVLVGVCVWLVTGLGRDFLPKFDEGSVQVNVTLPSGSSLQASNDAAAVVDRIFHGMQQSPKNPTGEILYFVRRTGRAELDEHAMPVSGSEYILTINPHSGRRRDEIIHAIEGSLQKELPGVDVEVEQPLNHLMSHMLSGVPADIAIKVYGDDLGKLRATADQIKSAITDVPGIRSLKVDQLRESDELHIRLRPDDLSYHGVSRAYVAEFVQTALQGEPVSQVIDGQRRFDLVLRLEESYRTDYAQLGELRIDLPNNRGQVKLSDLADIGDDIGPNGVKRENARRWLAVSCNVQGRDLAGVVQDIQKRVKERVSFSEGYYAEYGGQFQSAQSATTLIAVLACVSVVGMFVVLMMLYPSVPITLQILNALPTAFIGGVLALVLTRQSLTVASMVGFISLGGIAVRNGILLVTHYFHLMKYEGEAFTKQMVLRGSLERLSPVLMTALTAGIGLVPLVVAGNEPGREILYPVATVILGGLVTSTFCEFLIHPGLFWQFSGKDADRLARAEHDEAEMLTGKPA